MVATQPMLFDPPPAPDAAEGPPRLGPAAVEYADARSLLTRPSGMAGAFTFTLNPYNGCGFACSYCYARFFVPDDDRRERWGEWVTVKRNARRLLARACRSGELRSEHRVLMSSVTDPYQPVERDVRLTRALLETMLEHGVTPALTVQTRSPIVARDLDLLLRFPRVRVNFSVTTDSEEVRLRYEPHAPAIEARLRAAERIAGAGIPVGICISPMLPVRDPEAFGRRLAAVRAERYLAHPLRPPGRPFATGSAVEALEFAREDGWNLRRAREARDRIGGVLANAGLRLQGPEGYTPA